MSHLSDEPSKLAELLKLVEKLFIRNLGPEKLKKSWAALPEEGPLLKEFARIGKAIVDCGEIRLVDSTDLARFDTEPIWFKGCPFCWSPRGCRLIITEPGTLQMQCLNCGARSSEVHADSKGWVDTENKNREGKDLVWAVITVSALRALKRSWELDSRL